MNEPISIIDLFSGPGGLGEGFSACRKPDGSKAFKIAVSVEMDTSAHKTLRLRAFLRTFDQYPKEYASWLRDGGSEPDWKQLYPENWHAAEEEAVRAELGKEETSLFLSERIRQVRKDSGDNCVLIGGPPCQAYSLVGRARNAGIRDYIPEKDHRNFLYKEYCRVLSEYQPAVFVMENVKGMLSSSVQGQMIFQKVVRDLENAGKGYKLVALSPDEGEQHKPRSKDFLIRAENHGVPQERHRVIIVGIRLDLVQRIPEYALPKLKLWEQSVSVEQVLSGMPRLRSGITRKDNFSDGGIPFDSIEDWRKAIGETGVKVLATVGDYRGKRETEFLKTLSRALSSMRKEANPTRTSNSKSPLSNSLHPEIRDFIRGVDCGALPNHATRGHKISDLSRYLFAACFAEVEGFSARAEDFPEILAPDHKSWKSGKFNDRFRVQLWNSPSKTVTSHIKKDGHYFIHPDAGQCRSLTVREAARLQTFPDDYVFLGSQGDQYHQVGNAVPPFLARQIAETILPVFEHI
ncbi:DNA cytosine methyltransferase [Falsiruegeria mediterranea]